MAHQPTLSMAGQRPRGQPVLQDQVYIMLCLDSYNVDYCEPILCINGTSPYEHNINLALHYCKVHH